MKKSKDILWVLLALAATLLWACSEGQKKGSADNKAQQYKTMTVSLSDQTLSTPYTARLTGRQTVEVRPQVSGTLTRICTAEGASVRQGQTLFVIDQVPYEAALNVARAAVSTAEARLATARMNYDNDRQLQSGQVVSDYVVKTSLNALKEAEAALAQAKAQEANARQQLSYTVVKSPVSGSASMIPYHVGALVGPSMSEPLVTVADDHEVYAYFSMTENQALDIIQQYGSAEQFIRQAPAVELLLSNGTSYAQKGRIDAVSGTVDASTGAVALRAVFPNKQRLLLGGGSATVVVPTHRKGCIVIPQEATYELQNRVFVYRVVDGKTKATPVEVFRLNNGREYIVERGLSEGDVIVSEGAGLLKEGVEVSNGTQRHNDAKQ
ncbi:MAG: efflux RND transporter periplasmic adaptor subunit [Prevotella sp.]|nr:efflux RND transporter periplasmic adaptor subunit [Prevotella sp.]